MEKCLSPWLTPRLQRDIYGQWPDGGTVKPEDSVVAMAEGQMLLVHAWSPYRNGPYFKTGDGHADRLHKHDPDRIVAVHLITANTNPTTSWSKINQGRGYGLRMQACRCRFFDEGKATRWPRTCGH
jgi:hypothetical protein